MKTFSLLGFLISLVVACNVSSLGEGHILTFTPSGCGLGRIAPCNFKYPLAIGSTLTVTISDRANSLMGKDIWLVSADPSALEVTGGPQSFTLTAKMRPAAETVMLCARSDKDQECNESNRGEDYINVTLRTPGKLGFVEPSRYSGIKGPLFEYTADGSPIEIWKIPFGTIVYLQVVAKDGSTSGQPLMGRFSAGYMKLGTFIDQVDYLPETGDLSIDRIPTNECVSDVQPVKFTLESPGVVLSYSTKIRSGGCPEFVTREFKSMVDESGSNASLDLTE